MYLTDFFLAISLPPVVYGVYEAVFVVVPPVGEEQSHPGQVQVLAVGDEEALRPAVREHDGVVGLPDHGAVLLPQGDALLGAYHDAAGQDGLVGAGEVDDHAGLLAVALHGFGVHGVGDLGILAGVDLGGEPDGCTP